MVDNQVTGLIKWPNNEKEVGRWILPGSGVHSVTFACWTKPKWLHRFMMEKLLGWKYRDY